ncbi:hypothetical protein ATANTOWER_019656 [Ataeniobius toweri]|uniref:Uncharacterized protein n=1 Tax=Ataeniobius toweri TaxID=208326 RepID=A0ABU7CK30_9TELE|nr:hypothetical protein [Ataeniobius toweri]
MEPELNEGKTRRGRKQQSNVSDKYLLLTPMINRCKLHLMTAKTLAAGKLQTMSDSQDLSKETKISTTQTTGDSNSGKLCPFLSFSHSPASCLRGFFRYISIDEKKQLTRLYQ